MRQRVSFQPTSFEMTLINNESHSLQRGFQSRSLFSRRYALKWGIPHPTKKGLPVMLGGWAIVFALRRNKETMHENYLMSERERWWNAYSAPASKAGSKAQVIPVEFTDKLSAEGKATMRIN